MIDKFYEKYETWLANQIKIVQKDLGLDNFNFYIYTEQVFQESTPILREKDIILVIKYFSSNKTFAATTQPIQIIALSEQNGLQVAQIILKSLAGKINFQAYPNLPSVGYCTKTELSDPTVMSNFNVVGYGFRSALYISGTLFILEDYIDVDWITVDGENLQFISFNFAYSMSGDTQAFSDAEISKTIKSVSTIVFSIVVPSKKSAFFNKARKVATGKSSGNSSFILKFSLNGEEEEYETKLANFQLSTAPGSVPGIQIGLMV